MQIQHLNRWLPFLSWMPGLSRADLKADLIAGLTGAVIVLPQGVAYAYIAGMPPEYGLYTAMVVAVISALFGSSMHMVSGPAAAISIVVFSVASSHSTAANYVSTVITLTLMVGAIQLAIGLLKLGTLVNFISHTVVIGFTSGAAILIASSQLKHVLGLDIHTDGSLSGELQALWQALANFNQTAVIVAVTTLVSAIVLKKLLPKLPHLMLGMIIGSLLCWLLDGAAAGVAMVGTMTGQLPPLALPELSLTGIQNLGSGALAIAMLGLIEAISIARAIAIRSGQRIDGNREVLGQGLGNLIGSFFSCFASSGSFTRSGANYDAGARSPLSVVAAALILMQIVLWFPTLTQYLPLPAMAGTVLLIAWNLFDAKHIAEVFKAGREEILVFVTTFTATLLIALEFAIYVGVLVSMALFLLRTSKPGIVRVAPIQSHPQRLIRNTERFQLAECPQMTMLRFDGSIYFGSVDHFQNYLRQFGPQSNITTLLINARGINHIDLAGAAMLAQEVRRLHNCNIRLLIASLKGVVIDELVANGSYQKIGPDCFVSSTSEAIELASRNMKQSVCAGCSKRIFRECQQQAGAAEHSQPSDQQQKQQPDTQAVLRQEAI